MHSSTKLVCHLLYSNCGDERGVSTVIFPSLLYVCCRSLTERSVMLPAMYSSLLPVWRIMVLSPALIEQG